MSILVTPQTKVLVQGITGSFGAKHAQLSIDYGTQIVAGVTPGKADNSLSMVARKFPFLILSPTR
jgi:succinyl-CoA synthetase alpha subunit